MTLGAIWCYLYNLKNVKATHGGVLLLVKLLIHARYSRFLNCTNGTKLRNAPHMKELISHFHVKKLSFKGTHREKAP